MIKLGSFDKEVSSKSLNDYLKKVAKITRVKNTEISKGSDKIQFVKHQKKGKQNMSIAEVQKLLISRGFFPGGAIDGICGYRTTSAIRLFQEYMRTEEKIDIIPDGVFGPITQKTLTDWSEDHQDNKWAPTIKAWKNHALQGTEYAQWLALFKKLQGKYEREPGKIQKLINDFTDQCATHKVKTWEVNPDFMHMIGIRRNEIEGKFDDIIILLIKGLVFKFQGSTEPGVSENKSGTPYLLEGQHDYQFGWHRKQYLALRPKKGVLIVRSKNDKRLVAADYKRGLEANWSINIHWGGKGMNFDVSTWSAGCQVINGSMYMNNNNEFIDCSSFVASNNNNIGNGKTRGAYNVLVDLVTALSGDLADNTVKYMLINEADLGEAPKLEKELKEARERAGGFLK